jgi:hypothetical protein
LGSSLFVIEQSKSNLLRLKRQLTPRAPDVATATLVGVCAFSSSLLGSKLVPSSGVVPSRPPVPRRGITHTVRQTLKEEK